VSNEHFALLLGQFVERKLQLVQKGVAEVERFRTGVGRWQQIFDLTEAWLKVSGFFLRKRSAMRLRATRNSQLVT